MSGTAYVDIHAGVPLIEESYNWSAGTTPNNAPMFTAPANCVIAGIVGRMETLETGAATVSLVKCNPGQSIANGTLLSSIALNAGAGAVAFANQPISEINVASSLTIAAGQTVGVQSTGSFSASSGNITIYFRLV